MKTSSGREARPVTDPSKCRSCGAEVLWAEWASGKKMPVDEAPDMRPSPKGGNLVLTLRGGPFGALIVEKYDPAKHDHGRHRYTSHFATCPSAGGWRNND